MQLEHSFTVPVDVEQAWQVLLDIERIAPCMPGAALDSVDGDDFTGTVKVKLGPIGLTYKGKASFVEKDADAHRIAINAQGRDARGNGTAAARVTATLTGQDGATHVDVRTDLDITGKPAQFGRGVMVDVGNKLIGQFADCLAGKLAAGGTPDANATPAPADTAATKAADTAATKAADKPATKAAAKKAPVNKAAAKKEPAKKAAAKKEPVKKAAPVKKAGAKKAAPAKQVAAAARTAPATVSSVAEPRESARMSTAPSSAPAEVEPINLLESAGPAIAKRLAPVVALVVLALILLRLRLRRR